MENNEYTLTIKVEGASGGSKAVASNNLNLGGNAKPKSKSATPDFDVNKTAIGIATFGIAQGYKYYNYEANRVELRTGSSRLQEKAQFNYSINERIAKIGTSAISGAILTGSPYGAIAGAVISVVDQTIDYTYQVENLRLEKEAEGVTNALTRIRIGTAGGRQGNTTY
jgi:hypothetical protein